MGDAAALRVECLTSRREVAGLTSARALLRNELATKQYELVAYKYRKGGGRCGRGMVYRQSSYALEPAHCRLKTTKLEMTSAPVCRISYETAMLTNGLPYLYLTLTFRDVL